MDVFLLDKSTLKNEGIIVLYLTSIYQTRNSSPVLGFVVGVLISEATSSFDSFSLVVVTINNATYGTALH